MSDKTNRLNIYLIKDEFAGDEHIIKDGFQGHAIDGVGTFYSSNSHVRPPDWIANFFGTSLGSAFNILSASSRGVLVAKAEHNGTGRVFAVVFGQGRHLLKDGVTEERFGLKVVLNSVERTSLRSIDRTALSAVPKQSREQMSRESEAASFGIDIEQDLVRAVTGRSKDARLGKTISGSDALAVSVKVKVAQICDFLGLCLERHVSNEYKTDFEWVDQIQEVRNSRARDDLNEWVIGRLNAGDVERVWMAPPSIVDWVEIAGFKLSERKKAELVDDLDIKKFVAEFNGEEITLQRMKDRKVVSISSKTEETKDRWPAFNCIYAEATLNGSTFILNNGKWYEIAQGFVDRVVADFEAIPYAEIQLPVYCHANEGAYNEAATASLQGAFCMDRNLVYHGGGRSSIEFCDILTSDKKLIHVKHYSGSAQLSHLFSQGVVSGELFVQDAEFREKVNEKLPEPLKLADPKLRPDPSTYEVIYAIISKSNNPLDIPFFSKVNLRSARRRLEGYRYRVTKMKISVEES